MSGTKISALPLGSAATTNVNDVIPYVDTIGSATKKIKLSDLVNLPAFASITGGTPGQDNLGPGDGSTVAFALSHAPSLAANLSVFAGGLFQEQGPGLDYNISGSTITFTTAPAPGVRISATYRY